VPLGARLGHFFRGLGVNILEGYGLTETTAGGTLNLPSQQRIGSVGRPIPGCSVRISDSGEVLLKGAHVFSGYWNDDAATAQVFDEDGWFHTGDVGWLDEDGYLYITDRMKDLIITSAGKNVAPAALEDRLRAHWLVSQAFVFGDARPYVAALLTIDVEALAAWRGGRGLPTGVHVTADAELVTELQRAVDEANSSVSQAESIRRWAVLDVDFSETLGELTPTLKLRRKVIADKYADDIEALYG
jgi:long-chain acyl-CoA synthetase